MTLISACRQEPPPATEARGPAEFDEEALLVRVEVLASDSLTGRATGSPGGAMARTLIVDAFRSAGLDSFGRAYEQPFAFADNDGRQVRGVNLLGRITGTQFPDRYLVISAHYDHLGVRDGEIYNGADDNASGTSAIIALGEFLAAHPPRHTIIIAAFDAEERGLQGSRHFVSNPPVALESIVANINLDMVSRSEAGELYAAGTYHYPELRGILESIEPAEGVTLIFGHDEPGEGGNDWTMASDHAPFHAERIPFVYFGVEDHAGYHKPTDDFGDITPAFYVSAVWTILDAVLAVDRAFEP